MKVSELIAALEEFQTKLTEHEELLDKRAGQRAELSVPQKQAALEEQSRWLSRRLGALRPYIERFDNEWMMQHPATGVTWDTLNVATSLTRHPGKNLSLRHIFPKLHQILGRLETLDPNEEIPTDRGGVPISGHEDWIPASSAVALLGIGNWLARRTICQRAHAGIIKARAKRFVRDGQSADNVEIPREFWWAKGEEALTQNWATGDFETWIDHRIHLEAFGVTFRRSDIELSRPAPVVANDGSPTTSTHRNASGAKDRDIILMLAERFHGVVRQIGQRHDSRPTLAVADEYDVQDLFHALLTIYFDDIRKEEWAPSYAGGASRMDFLLPEIEAVVETKMMRPSLSTKQLGEQLIVDIAKYKSHPACCTLFCVVYDPNGRIENPRGVESDLSTQDHRLVTRVMIVPKQ
jgi:hypothetical protein